MDWRAFYFHCLHTFISTSLRTLSHPSFLILALKSPSSTILRISFNPHPNTSNLAPLHRPDIPSHYTYPKMS
jgi:hypothetical protein